MGLSLIPGLYRGEFSVIQKPDTRYYLLFEILSVPELSVFKRYTSKSGYGQETDARIFAERQAECFANSEFNFDLYEEDKSLLN